MQNFPSSVSEADKKVLEDISSVVEILRCRSETTPTEVTEGLALLVSLRNEIYEELNQIQHEALAVRAVEWLKSKDYSSSEIEWNWNPRQTGDSSEPDIRAELKGKVVASGEVSASENPKGSIDTHMAKTLLKLSTMQGKRYYFVRTASMANRARTKIGKGMWSIEVVQL